MIEACAACGVLFPHLERDHILPRSKGGTNAPENIQLLCPNCHRLKTKEDLKGRKVSEEARARMSANNKGRKYPPRSPEYKAKLSSALKGRRFSLEHRANLSAFQKTRKHGPHSTETRTKMSETHTGHPVSEETRTKIGQTRKQRRNVYLLKALSKAQAEYDAYKQQMADDV